MSRLSVFISSAAFTLLSNLVGAQKMPDDTAWLIYDVERQDIAVIDVQDEVAVPRGNSDFLATRPIPYKQPDIHTWQDGPTVVFLPGAQPWMRGKYRNGYIAGNFLDEQQGSFSAYRIGPSGKKTDIYQICSEPGVSNYQCVNVGQGQACGEPLTDGKKSTYASVVSCHIEVRKRKLRHFSGLKVDDLVNVQGACGRVRPSIRSEAKRSFYVENDTDSDVAVGYVNYEGSITFSSRRRPGTKWRFNVAQGSQYILVTEDNYLSCIGAVHAKNVEEGVTLRLSQDLR